ncbi:hypothetical protein L1987_82183 [Smallanthus sonchifolius]|uniref:Uncharacterized protein n=1 Tax=Smallanthus sonchifolius TaxID=185202 RepID=A0ACB8YE92_9ASTR|nr:hypothetical protein L1987_82183 [Smallanthus sonchifolius]
MEIKNPESTQDLLSTNNGEESWSYTCSFCKRGFSNAQALGGHMNVHRRDRAARLQEETLISKETTKAMNLNSINQLQSSDKGVPKRPWILTEHEDPRKKDHHGVNFKKPILQLSLCIDPSSTSSSSLSSSATEVDLELRLGIDSEMKSRDREL